MGGWVRGREGGWKGESEHSVTFQTPAFPEQSAAKYTPIFRFKNMHLCRQNIYPPLAPLGRFIPPRNFGTCNDKTRQDFQQQPDVRSETLVADFHKLCFCSSRPIWFTSIHLDYPLFKSGSSIQDHSCFSSTGIKQLWQLPLMKPSLVSGGENRVSGASHICSICVHFSTTWFFSQPEHPLSLQLNR